MSWLPSLSEEAATDNVGAAWLPIWVQVSPGI